MLTKTDLKNIDKILQKRIAEVIEEIIRKYREYIKDHEKRIGKLESASSLT